MRVGAGNRNDRLLSRSHPGPDAPNNGWVKRGVHGYSTMWSNPWHQPAARILEATP